MKIALVHNRYLERGGEDSVFDAEYKMLSQIYDVKLYETSSQEMPSSPVASALLTIWNQKEKKSFSAFLKSTTPDIIHVHNTFPYLSPSIYWSTKDYSVPIVQTLHNYRMTCINGLLFRNGEPCELCVGKSGISGVIHSCYRDSYSASLIATAMMKIHKSAGSFGRVHTFITLTDFARKKLIESGIPSGKIIVKPNSTQDQGENITLGDYALFVGRLSGEKGIETLIEAWKVLGNRLPLKIVGDGPLGEKMKSMGLPNITFLGRKNSQEVSDIMKNALVLVFPSKAYETFGLVVVEAMSCGLPSIVSSASVASEIVTHRMNGLHFQSGNASSLIEQIRWVLDHPREWLVMRKKARQEYEAQYTNEKNLESLSRIYKNAIESMSVSNKL